MKARAKAVARQRVDHRILWLLASLTVVAIAAFTYFSQTAKASVNYTVDFTDYQPARGPIDAWLKSKGFRFERDASSQR